MKVLLINGSPNGHGCTYTALKEIEKTLRQEGVETEMFYLGNKPIGGCVGCGSCRKTGKCVQDDIVNKILRAGNHHEKEYLVTVNKPINETFVKGMSAPVYLKELDVTTRSCQVEQTGKCSFRIILTQGYNRQIRRMCESFGYQVTKLKRIRIMNIHLDDLKVGSYREIYGKEMKELLELIKDSSSETVRTIHESENQ